MHAIAFAQTVAVRVLCLEREGTREEGVKSIYDLISKRETVEARISVPRMVCDVRA